MISFFKNIKSVGFDLDNTLYKNNKKINNIIRNEIAKKILEYNPSLGNIKKIRKIYDKKYKKIGSWTKLLNNLGLPNPKKIMYECLSNVDITPLLTLLGVGGLTVALALQPTLSNFFSGIYIIAAKEFSIGDFIRLDTGEEGYIVDMNWRHTVIRPPAKYDIIIPNIRLATASVTNFGISSKEIQITVPLGVGYESDLENVEKVTIEVAIQAVEQVQGVKPTTLPYIRYHTFAPSSIDFNVNIYSQNLKDRAKIRHEFIKLLYKRYKSEGIDIPYPTTVVLSKPLP